MRISFLSKSIILIGLATSFASKTMQFNLKDQNPYPPQTEAFIKDIAPGFELLYDYLSENDATGGKNREIADSAEGDTTGQFSFVLNKESDLNTQKQLLTSGVFGSSYAIKKATLDSREKLFSGNFPAFRWNYNNNAKFTSEATLESAFKLKPLGTEKFFSINSSTAKNTTAASDLSAIFAVAVDNSNKILKWQDGSWSVISQEEDHCHAADVAFSPIYHERLSSNEATKRFFDKNKAAASTVGVLGGLTIGAPALAIMAIVGATTERRDYYTIKFEDTRFFKINDRWGFEKYAAIDAYGDTWIIGSDQAPYYGKHDERFKHLTSKDPRTFFLGSNQRIFDISVGDNCLAVVNETGVFFCQDIGSLSVETWVKHPAQNNSLINKLNPIDGTNKTQDLPGGVATIACGKGNDILWAVNQRGYVYQLTSTPDGKGQKGWKKIPTPDSILFLKCSVGAINASAKDLVLLIASNNEVYLLVDELNWIWRKLELLTAGNGQFSSIETFAVRDASINQDGSAFFVAGGLKSGNKAYFATAQEIAEFGSPLLNLKNMDSVTISTTDNYFLCLNQANELTLEKYKDQATAAADQNCIFTLFRHGDVFGLKARNGKWLQCPISDSQAIEVISASGDNQQMDDSQAGIILTGSLELNNLQFVAIKVPDTNNADIIRTKIIARNNGQPLIKLGKFITNVNNKSSQNDSPFFSFTKVQDSSKFPIYIRIAESITNDTVRIGFYMQLLKQYMQRSVYLDDFFTNQNETVLYNGKDNQTLNKILSNEWKEKIPAITDNESGILLINSIKNLIDKKIVADELWSEQDTSNIKKLVTSLNSLFEGSTDVKEKLSELGESLSKLSSFQKVTFKDMFEQIKTDFQNLVAKNSSKDYDSFIKKVKALADSRVLGETIESGDGTNSTGIDLFVIWLVRETAKSDLLSQQKDSSIKSSIKELEAIALGLIKPITIGERFAALTKILEKPFLLSTEKIELERQIRVFLTPEILNRLTPNETTKLKTLIARAINTHSQNFSKELSQIQDKTIIECLKNLRKTVDLHSDSVGYWDTTKDNSKTNPDGIKVWYSAFTIEEFYDDAKRLLEEILEYKKSQKPEVIPLEMAIPIKLILEQLADTLTKGEIGKQSEFSELIKNIKDQFGRL